MMPSLSNDIAQTAKRWRLQGARTCWFSEVGLGETEVAEVGDDSSRDRAPLPTLLALERTIAQRKRDAESGAGAGHSQLPLQADLRV